MSADDGHDPVTQYDTLVEATKGFMPFDEGRALHDAALGARPGTWLEIGTYCGRSTLLLADAARVVGAQVVTVDHHHGSEENQPGWPWHDATLVDPVTGRLDTVPALRHTLAAGDVEDVVTAVVATTAQVAGWWRTPVQFLFLDGNHTEATAQHDYAAFAPWVVSGGLLAVHDVFADPADGGQAPFHVLQRALADGFRSVRVTGSLRVVRAP